MPLKVQKFLEIPIGTTNAHNMERKKIGPSIDGKIYVRDVRTISVVSDKQRQAGSSGSAPATPQGNNLPPAVPPPSISRNPLRGSKCNSLHCDYSSTPLPHPFCVSTLLLKHNTHLYRGYWY